MNKAIIFLSKINLVLAIGLACYSVTACANTALVFRYAVIDEELKPYTTEYFNDLKKYCPNGDYNDKVRYVIEITDAEELEEEGWIGVCRHKLNGFHIQLKRSWWQNASESKRLQLVYHEMAHCLIDREHDPRDYHYMFAYFSGLPKQVFKEQSRIDILEYCKEQ